MSDATSDPKWAHWVSPPYNGSGISQSQTKEQRTIALDAFEAWTTKQPFSPDRRMILAGTVRYAREVLVNPKFFNGPSPVRYAQVNSIWAIAHYTTPLFATAVKWLLVSIQAESSNSLLVKYVFDRVYLLEHDVVWLLQRQSRPLIAVLTFFALSALLWSIILSFLLFVGVLICSFASTPESVRARLSDAYANAQVCDRCRSATELRETMHVGDYVDSLATKVNMIIERITCSRTRSENDLPPPYES